MLMLGDFIVVDYECAQTLGYIIDKKGEVVTAFINGVAGPCRFDAKDCTLVEGCYSLAFVYIEDQPSKIARIISTSLH